MTKSWPTPTPPTPQLSGVAELLRVMAALRAPGTGCPWDLEQTSESLAPYTLEEAYEVVDAIETGVTSKLKEELGDLLLQIVYHARIAEEQSTFTFDEIAEAAANKMIARHPHVFGADTVGSAAEQTEKWEQIKAQERETSGDLSALSGVAPSLPALTRALRLQKRAARVGFDWTDVKDVAAKMREELAELEDAIANQDSAGCTEELGDILFTAVNFARHLDVEPETALRTTNRKFEHRFRAMEAMSEDQNKQLSQLSQDALDQFWQVAKMQGRTHDGSGNT